MELTVQHEDLPNCQMKLDVEIPFSELKTEYDSVKKDIAKSVQLPGFRKGKVPSDLIDQRYKPAIEGRVIEKILPKAYEQAVRDNDLKTFGQPSAEKVSDFEENTSLKVEFKVDRMPSAKIKKISGITVIKDQVEITSDDVQEEIDRILRGKAKTEDKEGSLEFKDFARVDILPLKDEHKALEQKEYPVELRKNNPIPGHLLEDFIGMKKDETKTVKKKYPKELKDTRLAGKTIEFELKVHEIKKIVLPEITEDLLKELNFENQDDLNNKSKVGLENHLENHQKNDKMKQALDGLRKQTDFEISDNLVKMQASQYIENLKRQFGGDDKIFESFLAMQNQSIEKLIEEYEETAVINIENELMLQELILEQKIEATEDQINEKIQEIAKEQKKEEKEMRKELIKSGDYTNLKQNLNRELAIDLIVQKGKLKKGKKITMSDLLSGRV